MITLLVPTMNRSEYLIRLIRYYYSQDFDGKIFIGDSSNAEHLARTKEAIAQYGDKFEISLKEYPGFTNAQCTQDLLKNVTTPYCAFVGDDDFLTVDGINQCIEFLDKNDDFCAAHGKGVTFNLDQPGAYGKVIKTLYYTQPEILNDTPSDRLHAFMLLGGVPMFSIFRSEIFQMMFRNIHHVNDMSLSTEVLPCCLSAIAGKNKELDVLMLFRQLHDEQYHYVLDRFDWMTSPNWPEAFQAFRQILADELVLREGSDIDSARNFVKKEYSAALIRILEKTWRSKYGPRPKAPSLIGKITYKLLNISLIMQERKFKLSSLETNNSKYFDQFIGVRSILNGSGNVI